MYPERLRRDALSLLEQGETISAVSRELGISRAALRDWRDGRVAARSSGCPRCECAPIDQGAYSALLGFYLGDGTISAAARHFVLRVACDARLPGVVEDVGDAIRRVRQGNIVFHVQAPGVVVVQANWKHWPCLFPQHGPGRKHERPIVLEVWQRSIVEATPAAFLRGLFHSDGSRVKNWARQRVGGEPKRYDYPRWQFTNHSADIRGLCCWALDLVDVPWRQSNAYTISVSTRAGVGRLDELIGLKA